MRIAFVWILRRGYCRSDLVDIRQVEGLNLHLNIINGVKTDAVGEKIHSIFVPMKLKSRIKNI